MVRFMVPANVAPLTTVGLSPDGRYLVYTSTESGLIGTSPLLLRQLDRLDSRVIAGTEKALWNYVWSPDSRYLAFFDDAGVRSGSRCPMESRSRCRRFRGACRAARGDRAT